VQGYSRLMEADEGDATPPPHRHCRAGRAP
jgi:hypothetical protein